jgi:hypothetical protein
MAYVYHILYTFTYVCIICGKESIETTNGQDDLQWMRTCFEQGKIIEYWKSNLELEKCFDPAFEEFINKKLIPTIKK